MASTALLSSLVVAALRELPAFKEVEESLAAGDDISFASASVLRAPFLVTQLLTRPRTILAITESEEKAEGLRNDVLAYLDDTRVLLFPARTDYPWQATQAHDRSRIVERARALDAMATGAPVIIIASVQALMRGVPLEHPDFFRPLSLRPEMVCEPAACASELIARGYTRADRASEEGSFSLHGDTLDIHPPLGTQAVRVEFFGDEIESIKRMVPISGQTLGELDHIDLYGLREFPLDDDARARGVAALEKQAFLDSEVALHRELLQEGATFAEMERYLPVLVQEVGAASAYLSSAASVEVLEPRILFDAAMKESDRLTQMVIKAGFKNVLDVKTPLAGLYLSPAQLDFGGGGRLTWMSTLNSARAELSVLTKRPDVAGSDAKLVAALRSHLGSGYTCVVALSNRRIRERVEDLFAFEAIPVGDRKGAVRLIDEELVNGFVVPDARLAVIGQGDAFPKSIRRSTVRRDVDVTKLTFGFKPGDYVVHESYGIALLKEFSRRVVDDVERDYLTLEYAEGDTLFTPVDQIDKITKYVGPDGSDPKLTRLGGRAWARALDRARKSAKKLAFDLVNLYARRTQVRGYAFGPDTVWQREMEEAFPYEETPDQNAAIADVKADMEADKPMDRLICGDVGYGKTEVAIRAAFKAVQDDKQVMILCPTTILAQQHFTTFSERFAPYDIPVEVLSRFRTEAQQRAAVEGFSEGRVKVLVGTHRLLSKDISPRNLGLLIIDEEQRFGVEHKEKLKNMRENIDVLAMSATPIPRTLQMSLSGVRDMSVIDTPPADRHPVKVHVGLWDEDIVAGAIRRELERHGQVYYVSNRVRTIDDAYERIAKAAPEARIGVAHGQMSEKELEEVMEAFSAHEVDVLLATTIVESGIDNPHSNTLIIEDSHRLGLSQLYQLKGRVGRSHEHAFAYFLYPPEVAMTPTAVERLMAIAEHDGLGSGIRIAMRDLEIRGAGSLLGAEQSGQLSSIGFDLFASMIAEAVGEARGEAAASFPDIHIDIPDAAFVPSDYIDDVFNRITLYRRIAGLATTEGINKFYREMVDAYGTPPLEVENLYKITRIKVSLAQIEATGLSVEGRYIQVRMPKPNEHFLAEMRSIGALYDERRKMLKWQIPYGESVVDAAYTLAGAILFDSTDHEAAE